MHRALALSLLGLLACGERPTLPTPEPPPEPVLLISQKGAKSVAWYSLGGELLEEVPVSDHPHEIVLSPDGRRLYVTDNGVMQIENAGEGGNKVSIIDVLNRAKGGQIDLGKWHRPHGVDLCADGSLLVTTENPDQLLVIDLDKLQIRHEYATGGETPHIVKCSRDSRFAFVSNARSGTVAKVALDSGERELVETGARPEGSTLSKDGSKLYVAHRDADKVVIIDTIAWRMVADPNRKVPGALWARVERRDPRLRPVRGFGGGGSPTLLRGRRRTDSGGRPGRVAGDARTTRRR
ncbi:MAG: hypothetical protein R2748_13225 [Bryobacterales bacterium]